MQAKLATPHIIAECLKINKLNFFAKIEYSFNIRPTTTTTSERAMKFKKTFPNFCNQCFSTCAEFDDFLSEFGQRWGNVCQIVAKCLSEFDNFFPRDGLTVKFVRIWLTSRQLEVRRIFFQNNSLYFYLEHWVPNCGGKDPDIPFKFCASSKSSSPALPARPFWAPGSQSRPSPDSESCSSARDDFLGGHDYFWAPLDKR